MRKKQRWRFADLAGLVILWQSLKHKGSWEPELAPLLVGLIEENKHCSSLRSNPFKSSIHDRQLCSLQLDFAFVEQTHFSIHRLKPLTHIDPHLIIRSQNRGSTIDRHYWATDKSISISVALTSVSYDLIIQIRLRPSLQWTLHRCNHQHRHHNYSR